MKKIEVKNRNKRGMQPYVDYLLKDILDAEQPENERDSYLVDETDLMSHLEEVERLIMEDPLNTFGQICGLVQEQFPPAEQLSLKQIKQVNKAYHRLLLSWNSGVDFPKKFPSHLEYNFLVTLLNEKIHIVKNGFSCFEFCTCDPPSCPFKEYCTCRDLLDKKSETGDKGDSGSTSLASPKRLREGK